ncbi:MAG: acyl-CoA thioesterase [Bacteroidia bacterium]
MSPLQIPQHDHFLFSSPIHIRWADIDALQHVNNAVYLNYFEQARIDYFREVVGWKWEEVGMILASNTVNYHKPLFPRDKAVVRMRTSRLGTKSFEMEYIVCRMLASGKTEIITTASAVLVVYDYKNDRTIPMPEDYRQAIVAFESGLTT